MSASQDKIIMTAKEQKIVYLLGAGFSHAITPENKAPLTTELGEELGKIFPLSVKKKYGFSAKNIELFLTKIDLALEENGHDKPLKVLREKVTSKIGDIFDISNLTVNGGRNGLEVSPSADNVTNLLFRKNDTILTINYDCYLENILLTKRKWSPRGGYGVFPPRGENENKNILNIDLFKLHGSINFILHAAIEIMGSGLHS